MKKVISIIIVVFLVLAAAVAVQSGKQNDAEPVAQNGAEPERVVSTVPKLRIIPPLKMPQNAVYSFITYSSLYQNSASTADNGELGELVETLESAAPVAPLEGVKIAAIEAVGEETVVLDIIKDEAGQLYLQTANNYYMVDSKRLANACSLNFLNMYVHMHMPEIYTNSAKNNELACQSLEFGFYWIDGSICSSSSFGGHWQTPERIKPVIVSENKLIPLYFDWQPEGGLACIITDSTGAVVFDGSYADARGTFELKELETYYIKLTAKYNNEYFVGSGNYFYNIMLNTSKTEIVFSGGLYPGEALIIEFENPQNFDVSVNSPFTHTPNFFVGEDGKTIGFLPITYHVVPGNYTIGITIGGYTREYVHKVNYKDFQVQYLTVGAQTSEQTLYSQQANEEFERVIAPLRTVADSTQHWQGRFILPVDSSARITTGFGAIRYTNGSTTASRHGALDLAIAEGTPVYASNSGRVLYAGFLQLTGNTIVVEHGFGIKTWHYHMSSLNVETGQMITQGDLIGAVGTTGFSSGPHLHFGMSVGGAFINPATAIETDLFEKEFI